jgi:hypothetical protein
MRVTIFRETLSDGSDVTNVRLSAGAESIVFHAATDADADRLAEGLGVLIDAHTVDEIPGAGLDVAPGMTFRQRGACGVYRSRVRRPHRDAGYWETEILSGGHPALLGSIQIVAGHVIRSARNGRY